MIDDGARSELSRDGRFRFDNVRLGSHTVVVDMDSLDEGTQVVGEHQRSVTLTRDARNAEVVFLIRREKRPEVRKVFPAKKVRVPELTERPTAAARTPKPWSPGRREGDTAATASRSRALDVGRPDRPCVRVRPSPDRRPGPHACQAAHRDVRTDTPTLVNSGSGSRQDESERNDTALTGNPVHES